MIAFALASAGVFLTPLASLAAQFLSAALSFSALVSHWRFPGYATEAIFLVFLTLAAARVILTRRSKWLFLTGLGIGYHPLGGTTHLPPLEWRWAFWWARLSVRRGFRDVATAAIVAALPSR
jgi:hypothetical protein